MSVWVLDAPDGFGDPHVHAHHAIQITLSLTGALALMDENAKIEAAAIAVAPDAPHSFAAHGLLVFIFVEPESREGRGIADTHLQKAIAELDAGLLLPLVANLEATFDDALGSAALLAAGERVVGALVPPVPARLPDPRIQRLIDRATSHLDESLPAAAEATGIYLSPSRLRHMFVEQTGLAYKTYLLWLRLMRALEVYSSGRSLTEAAHAAGFSDSAHLSRTFKRTFGLPATTLERL